MRVRPTARVVVLDERQRTLLFRYEDPNVLDLDRPSSTTYWGTVGGGLEAGETYEEAAVRELWEETGLRVERIGPLLWVRERMLRFPAEDVQFLERYYLARVRDPQLSLDNLLPYERQVCLELRWWTLAELRASDAVVLPEGFAELLAPILEGHLPADPLHIR